MLDKGLNLCFFNPRNEPKRVWPHQNKRSSFSPLWLLLLGKTLNRDILSVIREDSERVETLEYPARIEAVSLTIAAKSREMADLRNEIALQESVATLEILNAKDEHSKPLYSNETARSAALKISLAANPEYQELERRLAAVEMERSQAYAALERLRGEFKLYLLDRQQGTVAADSVLV